MENNDATQIAVPLQMNVDLQLGPDGHPWIRYQVGTPALTASWVIPLEHAETFLERLTDFTRKTAKKAMSRQADIVTPDFSGIAAVTKSRNGN